jgi:hypothetical protein
MPLLKLRRVLAAKIEATVGTAIALTSGTDGMINAYDVVIDDETTFNERESYGGFGRQVGVTGTRAGSVKFKVEAVGSGASGTAPAWALVLLESCGMATTAGVFSPLSLGSAQKSATIGVYEDGAIKSLCGAMGTWSFDAEDGKVGVFSFDYKGVWIDPTDGAMFTPQFSAVIPPRCAGATFTVGAFTPTASKFAIKQGNKVEMREDMTNAAGFISAIITDRVTTGSLDPEQTLVAGYDAFGTFKAGTTAALAYTIGSGGTGLSIAVPALQYNAPPKEGDRNGKNITNLSFLAAQNGSTVDNELTITF